MTLNDLLQAVAAALKEIWPERKAYVNQIPQNADGAFSISLTDTEQVQGLDRRQRRTVGVQILYFRKDRDAEEYADWAETMYSSFKTVSFDGRPVKLKNRMARNDSEFRYFQFMFDVDFYFVEASTGDPMEGLTIEEELK
ncbi:hypothetical protein DSECCO2_362940 [anaerobic digester metagenome]